MHDQPQNPVADAGRSAAQAAQLAAEAAARTAANAAQATQAAITAPPAPALTGFERMTFSQLKRVQSELQDQRQVIANRRGALADSYERTSGANKDGMGARLQIMDNNIVQLEANLAVVGRELATKAGSSSGSQSSDQQSNVRWNDDDVAGMGFGVFLGTVLVTVLVMRRFARRRGATLNQHQQPNSVQSNQRLDRIEQAVDTIAVEIERVSENQRFMTRLMTETQLGATINEVRKSTELARSAAEQAG